MPRLSECPALENAEELSFAHSIWQKEAIRTVNFHGLESQHLLEYGMVQWCGNNLNKGGPAGTSNLLKTLVACMAALFMIHYLACRFMALLQPI